MSLIPNNFSMNGTSQGMESPIKDPTPNRPRPLTVFFLCLTFVMTITTLVGSIYSLVCLLRMPNKTVLSMMVASWSVDDMISVLPMAIFLFLQWPKGSPRDSQALCATSAFLYLFQGISSNLKASVIVCYNFYTLHRSVASPGAASQPRALLGVLLTIWVASLLICTHPLWTRGAFERTPWGCLADHNSSLLLFVVYSLSFCVLAGFSVPLTYQLLCSDQLPGIRVNYQEISRGGGFTPCTPPSGGSALPTTPEDPRAPTVQFYRRPASTLSSEATYGLAPPAGLEPRTGAEAESRGYRRPGRETRRMQRGSRSFSVSIAQKRFSLILALTKVVLWLPMMIHTVARHTPEFQSLPFELFSFLLTALAATVTPVFVLSERWTHLPCGCIINCPRNAYAAASEESKTKGKGFEFNLSFQHSYGIYKIAHDDHYDEDEDENSISYHNLMDYECEGLRDKQKDSSNFLHAIKVEFSTASSQDSSMLPDINKSTNTVNTETKQDSDREKSIEHVLTDKAGVFVTEDTRNLEKSTFLEGPERRLSHEESHKPELSDWEWCRSKSERTPRQRSGGALAIPLCAFQGTVSLHAPTGKTLSLSTYEVSAEGQKITPAAKKIEVYRSKSVGHEPNKEDSPTTFPDTSVKIHLEVLEICDNEEAMDTVSIISNISQSSTQVRSPSLRYSRKENRFVSCDLGETASYSLFIPTNNPDSDINISIPDTVEAHRQNSQKQHLERDGYQEEIQLLNKAYRKREEEGSGS
ncbi:probable G-protein coupled receptor 149 [Trichosurus vulpecula]|uniref:probable G-protein coupled receptor 149 n=1 Tax=Trichosurus vulpecula TaxID=9337 RepID=UPI00186AFD1C|nr:probable G-protein coupled receptor 149 [Trichosurus vulpecula]